ncbi:MAG: transcriptional regulator CysB [Gammaproteobacteria bacterium]|nr:transcriptional regulator CysB [Gammaproteobacteria bacterium]|tara:strand:- start:4685 stop:5665 length:981 start_codon:yes stop_codon:yes gene_type:complete
MKLQQIKYLLAIVDNSLNISTAANRMHTSQPGISKQLKLLEEELGIQLFTREGKSLSSITTEGLKVIERARVILKEVENIKSIALDYNKEKQGSLSIATTHTQARYVLPEIINKFRKKFPKIALNLHQGTSEQIADMVLNNDIDFAIATGSKKLFENLLLIPSYHWDRSIIVPKSHALSQLKRKITLKDLAQFPLVTYVFSVDGESSLKRAFKEEGLKPDIAFTARDADIIKTYVRMGMGVGIIASMANEINQKEGFYVLSAEGLFPRCTTWIGFRKNIILRRYMSEFLQLFAPHVSPPQLHNIQDENTQENIDALIDLKHLPLLK